MKKIRLFAVLTAVFLSTSLAFGQVQWDNCAPNGGYSSSIGINNVSDGDAAFSSGYEVQAIGSYSTAFGQGSYAIGERSFAWGNEAYTYAPFSIGLGDLVTTGIDGDDGEGHYSFAWGYDSHANRTHSLSFGKWVMSDALNAFVIGSGVDQTYLVNEIENSLMIGFEHNEPTLFVGAVNGPGNMGHVGIGTITPSYLLDVAGTAQVTNFRMPTGAANGYVLKSDASGNASWIPFTDGDWTISGINMYSAVSGNVGIGTTTPQHKLDVNGIIRANSTGDVAFDINSTHVDGTLWRLIQIVSSGVYGKFSIQEGDGGPQRLTILKGGNVGIATSDPQAKLDIFQSSNDDYALKVLNNGGSGEGVHIVAGAGAQASEEYAVLKVSRYSYPGTTSLDLFMVEGKTGQTRAREVVVDMNTWPDYVFDQDYSLLSLAELENYIKANNHLPEVPTEDEIQQGGINLGQMDAILLQKIEELTLYVIELKKEINELKLKK